MSRVDVRKDKSTERRQDVMYSPDRNKKEAFIDVRESIYDKVRRKVDGIVKLGDEQRLFRRSPDRYQSAKLFEKKHAPLEGQSYEEEESRELNIIQGKIPDINEKPRLEKKIYIQRIRIHPVGYNKPASAASTVKDRWAEDSSFSGLDIKDIRNKVLFLPSDGKNNRLNIAEDTGGSNKRPSRDAVHVVTRCNEIQSTYSQTYKLREKRALQIVSPMLILAKEKGRHRNEMSDHFSLLQHLPIQESTKTTTEISQVKTDTAIIIREDKLRMQNEIKFLSRSVEQLQKSVADLQDELRVSKFDRDNAITNYSQASKKIQDLNIQIDSLQRKSQKTSSQFGELIDYVYRQGEDRYIHRLEDLIGTDDKRMVEETHAKILNLNKKLAEISALIFTSKDKKLADNVNAVIRC